MRQLPAIFTLLLTLAGCSEPMRTETSNAGPTATRLAELQFEDHPGLRSGLTRDGGLPFPAGDAPASLKEEWEVVLSSLHDKSGLAKDRLGKKLVGHWSSFKVYEDFDELIDFARAVDEAATPELVAKLDEGDVLDLAMTLVAQGKADTLESTVTALASAE